jgi:hypothetical protein
MFERLRNFFDPLPDQWWNRDSGTNLEIPAGSYDELKHVANFYHVTVEEVVTAYLKFAIFARYLEENGGKVEIKITSKDWIERELNVFRLLKIKK